MVLKSENGARALGSMGTKLLLCPEPRTPWAEWSCGILDAGKCKGTCTQSRVHTLPVYLSLEKGDLVPIVPKP